MHADSHERPKVVACQGEFPRNCNLGVNFCQYTAHCGPWRQRGTLHRGFTRPDEVGGSCSTGIECAKVQCIQRLLGKEPPNDS